MATQNRERLNNLVREAFLHSSDHNCDFVTIQGATGIYLGLYWKHGERCEEDWLKMLASIVTCE
jgi:hypothetical protein